jgi:hypothetical protein
MFRLFRLLCKLSHGQRVARGIFKMFSMFRLLHKVSHQGCSGCSGCSRRTNCGAPKSYRNTLDTYPESGPLLYGMISGPKTSRTGRFRDPRYRARNSCRRLTPVSAHRSVTAGQMGSRPMVFGRSRYAGDLNDVACVRATGNRYGSLRRGRRAQALKSLQLLAPSLGSTDG